MISLDFHLLNLKIENNENPFLKTHKDYYKAVEKMKKQFELRENDREFQKGDVLILIMTEGKGKMIQPINTLTRIVDYVLENQKFLQPNYVAMSIYPFSLFAYLSDENFNIFRGHYDRISLSGDTYSYEVL